MNAAELKTGDIELLSRCFIFKGTNDGTLMRMLSDGMCRLQNARRGDVIYDQDNYKRQIGFVLDGRIQVLKPSEDNGLIMKILERGDVFGAAAVFNDEEGYVTKLTAMQPCRILFFPQELLKTAMKEDFALAENYITFLSGRIRFLNGKIDSLIIPTAEGALRRWLCENAAYENGKYTVTPGVSMTALASALNMGRASLYRSFDELEKQGTISRNGRTIEILDYGSLADRNGDK